jgi:TorA maturation chaperone TorD
MTSETGPVRNPATFLTALRRLCRLFWGPNAEDCEKLHSGEWFEPLEAIAVQEGEDGQPFHTTIAEMKTVAAASPSPKVLCEDLETAYVQTFINNRGGIAASLYQSSYESDSGALMGPAAHRMKERLAAAGLAVSNDRAEPPDHLGIELEYLYFLLAEGFGGSAEGLAEAADFTENEITPWVGEMRDRLTASAVFFYGPAVAVLLHLLHRIPRSDPAFHR